MPTPALITIQPDRSFTFELRSEFFHTSRTKLCGTATYLAQYNVLTTLLSTPTLVRTFRFPPRQTLALSCRLAAPPTALLLKRAAGITTGSGRTGSEYVGSISVKALYEIAKIKMKDIDDVSEEAVSEDLLPFFYDCLARKAVLLCSAISLSSVVLDTQVCAERSDSAGRRRERSTRSIFDPRRVELTHSCCSNLSPLSLHVRRCARQ